MLPGSAVSTHCVHTSKSLSLLSPRSLRSPSAHWAMVWGGGCHSMGFKCLTVLTTHRRTQITHRCKFCNHALLLFFFRCFFPSPTNPVLQKKNPTSDMCPTRSPSDGSFSVWLFLGLATGHSYGVSHMLTDVSLPNNSCTSAKQ